VQEYCNGLLSRVLLHPDEVPITQNPNDNPVCVAQGKCRPDRQTRTSGKSPTSIMAEIVKRVGKWIIRCSPSNRRMGKRKQMLAA